MVAYTAWDGLRLMAAEFDAELTLVPEGGIGLAPRCAHLVSAARERVVTRLAPAVAALLAVIASSAG